jgi:hypothetical protein
MAKALFALALWLCTSLSVLAAAPQKKQPSWAELAPAQQQVLAPLASDWDNFDAQRKRKWIGIAKRYPTLKPDEQARVQRRMQDWAKLTPEQRRVARERYKKIEKLPPEKRETLRTEWEQYRKTKPPGAPKKASPAGAEKPLSAPVAPGPATAAPAR